MRPRDKRFLGAILVTYITLFGVILFLGVLGDMHAITMIGVALGLAGIGMGTGFLAWLLWHPPFRTPRR